MLTKLPEPLKLRQIIKFSGNSIVFLFLLKYNTDNLREQKEGVDMNITDVRIRKINDDGKMKAVASVTFDNEFVVHDIKIIDGQNGLFVAMPSRKMGEGDFRDIAHPLVSDMRNKIKDAIFEAYEKALNEPEE